MATLNILLAGERIRTERITKGLTQSEIAEQHGVTSGAWRAVERGEVEDHRDIARALYVIHEGNDEALFKAARQDVDSL